jgi:transcriptional regulator with XRE-family HTH domain
MLELYKNIKKYRLERHMNQQQLAEKVGYSDKGMISRIENGKVDLSQSQIVKFAAALRVTPRELMGWEDDSPIYYTEEDYVKIKKNLEAVSSVPLGYDLTLSYEEKRIIERYRDADATTKDMVKRILSYAEKLYKRKEEE